SLFSTLDNNDNLFIYGGKSIGDTAQAMYLYKLSRINGAVIYNKTHFNSPGSQLNDFKIDRHNKIFALTTLYQQNGNQVCRVSRINANSGNIAWNHSINFTQDSCNLAKLVVGNSDRFYAVGQKMSHNYFSKGFAIRLKKSGQMDGEIPSPDSVAFQRLHWLADGITDYNNQLIALGGTSDLDSTTFINSYLRAFAVRYGNNNNMAAKGGVVTDEYMPAIKVTENEKPGTIPSLVVFPNPVQTKLTVSGLQHEEYDHITVYNMQGAVVLAQKVTGNLVHMDISSLADGVYMLVLRSSVSLKEKSLKFVVRK
ncbi:MAG TPA: T9SS type A sorting domain-containing protein, partial [Chitinophagaceae bacterium]|nr:T9SS type A sorting domain-containing protein [Chitinophagaceae bacterium]